ncbi:MAG TPA: hypothetical protein PLP42_11230 [Acidobacteriota bacterium]|jgi:hypothetical protein|nr:hypothetical protein [Acidobacteriota bacterium]
MDTASIYFIRNIPQVGNPGDTIPTRKLVGQRQGAHGWVGCQYAMKLPFSKKLMCGKRDDAIVRWIELHSRKNVSCQPSLGLASCITPSDGPHVKDLEPALWIEMQPPLHLAFHRG